MTVQRSIAVRCAVGVGALAAGALAVGGVYSATAHPSLPDRRPQQVLASLRDAGPADLSGTVVARSEVGVPPGLLDGAPSPGAASTGAASTGAASTGAANPGPDALAAITGLRRGTHSAKVWSSGYDRQRVLVIEPRGELDYVRAGPDVWTYDSATRRAVHAVVPLRSQLRAAGSTVLPVLTSAPVLTPEQLSAWALAAVDPRTAVTLDDHRRIADRSTYQLELTPHDPGSRIDRVRIAVDGDTSIPLAVSVYAKGAQRPVLDVGFTSVRFATPDGSNFRFVAPFATPVEQRGATGVGYHATGEGWTTVLRRDLDPTPAVSPPTSGAETVSGTFGRGRLVTTALLSVLVTDDGRMYIGAVDPQLVLDAAGR